MKKFSKLAAILAVCAFIFGGLLVSCSPHGTGYGLDDGQSAGSGGSGGAGGGSGNPGDGGGSGGGSPKTAGSISYATTSVEKNIGDAAFTNPLTKTGDGVVVYGSSDANVATVDTATGEVTIKAVGTTTIRATVSDSEAYTYETKSASYTLEVKNPVTIPLTLEFIAAGKINFINKPATLKYSFDGGETKADASEDSITVSAGGKVSLFAETTGSTEFKPFKISCDADCYVYGNVMSLVTLTSSGEWNPNARELASEYAFYQLFYVDGNKIKNHPSNNLVLPATTLTRSCYRWMFYGCTGLTRAPALPATTLVRFCYNAMFKGCASLTSAPALPATTLASNCYSDMFSGCTGLKSAPALLPATTLAQSCYNSMFKGCASLTSAPALPATTLAEYCYSAMFSGCTGLTSAPALLPATTLAEGCYSFMFKACASLTSAPALLPATMLARDCYNGMFEGCTSLTKAPDLPATTLADHCYQQMFSGCTALNEIKCLATDISAGECTTGWVEGVAANGTFTKASGMTGWTTGADGIPSGWTSQDAN